MRDRDEVPYIVVEKEGGGIGSFLVGALLGAGVALLFAPRSGEETQQEIKDRAIRFKGAAEERMRDLQAQLDERLEQARAEVMERVESIREAVESGRTAAGEARHELEDRIERSKAAYRAGIDAAREAAEEEQEEA